MACVFQLLNFFRGWRDVIYHILVFSVWVQPLLEVNPCQRFICSPCTRCFSVSSNSKNRESCSLLSMSFRITFSYYLSSRKHHEAHPNRILSFHNFLYPALVPDIRNTTVGPKLQMFFCFQPQKCWSLAQFSS